VVGGFFMMIFHHEYTARRGHSEPQRFAPYFVMTHVCSARVSVQDSAMLLSEAIIESMETVRARGKRSKSPRDRCKTMVQKMVHNKLIFPVFAP
jgi:hypothetical protein